MVHRENVDRYPGTLAQLALELGDLRYDALAEFLRTLATKLAADGIGDMTRGRTKLAAALHAASESLGTAATDIENAWAICAPQM